MPYGTYDERLTGQGYRWSEVGQTLVAPGAAITAMPGAMGVGMVGQQAAGDDLSKYRRHAGEERKKFTPTAGLIAGEGSGELRYRQPTGATQITTPIAPRAPMPTLGEIPAMQLPARDEARIRRLTQEAAAPGLRSLRRQTRMALLRQHYDDPRMRENIRAALAGHGEALSTILGEARRTGRAQYEAEYAPQLMRAQAEWQARIQQQQMRYQAALAERARQYGQRTTVRQTYTDTPGAEGVGVPTPRIQTFGGWGGAWGYTKAPGAR